MCGIFGVINTAKVDKNKFIESLNLQTHRGPDNTGIYHIDDILAMGHVRLSILDLESRSNQPFKFKSLVLVFNGEIFNYKEIRDELITNGYKFETTSDTEVVIKAYDFWGEKCVNKFNGMWALSIYSKSKNEMFISRDRFGIKPLYYAYGNYGLYFSSEIKSIINYSPTFCRPNMNVIHSYLRESLGGQCLDTWFQGVKRLEPAHNLIYDLKSKSIVIKRFWDYPNQQVDISFSTAKENYLKLLRESVKIRMRSDVPVGLTLSSGLDSTAIASIALDYSEKKIQAYTASFPDEKYDEYPKVKDFVKGKNIELNQVLTNYESYRNSLEKLIYHLESGHSSPAIVPLQSIMNTANKKVTVLLEGQGADELLAGYNNTFVVSYILNLFKKLKFLQIVKELKVIGFKKLISYYIIHLRLNGTEGIRKLMRKFYGIEKVLKQQEIISIKNTKKYHNLNDILINQHKSGLVNLLHYGDAVSMMYSLESRLPFMDYKLIEYVFSLPFEYKYKLNNSKLIHREAFDDILPNSITKDRNKIGFVSPIKEIIASEEIQNILLSDKFFSRNLVSKDNFIKLYKKQISGKKDYSRFLFRLLCVELWYRTFID